MRKDTSKIIDLDALFAKAESKQLKETLKESAVAGNVPPEVAARIDLVNKFNFTTQEVDKMTSNEALEEYNKRSSLKESIDIDSILMEWSYRCDKGYPDFNNKHDMIKLQEILDEMGVASPFKRITEAKLTKSGKEIYEIMSDPEIGLRTEALALLQAAIAKLSEKDQALVRSKLRTLTLDKFINGGWELFKPFFDIIISGFGRGELMCVMAIKDSRSGGTAEKDLFISSGPKSGMWEVKEDPTGIRMAQAGAAQKFKYVKNIRKFYELLENLSLNNKGQDKVFKSQLNLIFKKDKIAEDLFEVLTTNFRGDKYKTSEDDEAAGAGMFERINSGNEIPSGIIQLHMDGFEKLMSYRKDIINNPDLLSNSKLIIKSADKEDGYWITSTDAAKLKTAKADAEVEIHKGPKIEKGTKELLYGLVDIMNFEYSKNPKQLAKDIAERKDIYFSDINGYVYFFKKNPKPNIGFGRDFVVYGISQGQGKMRLAKLATNKFEKEQNS